MNTNYTIKNFRVFDETGANVELKPITILTGCNSSGKSSIAKSVLLLDSFLKQVKASLLNNERIELSKYKIDFTTYPNNLLGRFDRVVNSSSDSNIVSVEYSIYSRMLSCNLDVRMEFCADENDELNNAYLKSVSILKEGVPVYFSSKEEQAICNLNALKDEFCSFIEAEYVVHNFCSLESHYEFEGGISKEDYENQAKLMIDYLRSMDKTRRSDIFRYVRTANVRNSLADESKFNPGLLNWSKENDSFFNIPVIEWLNTFAKGDIRSKLEELLADEGSAEMMATEKVLNDFIASEFDNLGDFFKAKENAFLENVMHIKFPLLHHPNIPSVTDMEIDQMYMVMDPHNTVALYSWDGDEKSEEEINAEKQEEIQLWENRGLTFDMLYEIVMYWNSRFTKEGSTFYSYSESNFEPAGKYTHYAYSILCKFACRLINEALCPEWSGNMSYVSSSRVDVNRLYTLDGNDDFTQLLRNYFEKRRLFSQRQDKGGYNTPKYEPNSFINKWIKAFGIGDSVSLNVDEEGLGVQIRLHKEPCDKGRLLADEGYGITQLVFVLLQIETAILSAQGEKIHRIYGMDKLDGYDTRTFHYEINTIAIEEPEIHLHPRMQSLLADMFVEAYKKYNIHFIVETHSEYLIRKLQILVAGNENEVVLSNQEVSLLYIYSKHEAERQNERQVKQIGICKDGYLNDTFGSGFFDESSFLSKQLM